MRKEQTPAAGESRKGMGAPEIRRAFKRPAVSDQQKRRDLALLRQAQNRRDAQQHARSLASSIVCLPSEVPAPDSKQKLEHASDTEDLSHHRDLNFFNASRLRGPEARRWVAGQFMLPEWMIDIPPRLYCDWYVLARPSGQRCFVISSNGMTISRLRNGSILHHFPSALPNGARIICQSSSAQMFSLLDCIFHEPDQTYYIIDIVCWKGYSLCNCNTEFRFFWLNTKLSETGACNPSSLHHRYRFSMVPIYECNEMGLQMAYTAAVPYVKDGLLFYNKHAHYQTGTTPLVLVWKDEKCSLYLLDTDGQGQVPAQQQVVLKLGDDGKLMTSDDIPVGSLDGEKIQKSGLQAGHLFRFFIGNEGLKLVNGKLEAADINYSGKANPSRAFADSYSKILFQYAARRYPLRFEDILASIYSTEEADTETFDVEMVE